MVPRIRLFEQAHAKVIFHSSSLIPKAAHPSLMDVLADGAGHQHCRKALREQHHRKMTRAENRSARG